MKRILLLPLLLLFVLKSHAQILIYDCSTRIKSASNDNEIRRTDSGRIFYDWATTNYVNIMIDKPSKSFSVLTSSNAVAVTVQGKGRDTFTAFPAMTLTPILPGSAFIGPANIPGIGLNQTLDIGSSNTVIFPRTFTYQYQNVFYQGSFNTSFTMSTTTSTFSAAATRSANQQGQSINDAATAMVNSLQSAGYNQSN
jgi:hypothetical protein